mmetsp:Transcript_24034/g.51882  ORF Transcript_24034/g.51882 Transcript_24034/m.51882 type:complete len:253 (+) Transcript_24034:124-882(+)
MARFSTSIHPLFILKGGQWRECTIFATLTLLRPKQGFFHGIPNLNKLSLIPWHSTPDINKIPPPIDFDNPQILFRRPHTSHPTRHLLALEYLSRILTHARTTNRTMTLTRTMRGRHTLKPMPFHSSLKSLSLGSSRNINILSRNKVPGMNPRPRLRQRIRRSHTELPHNIRGVFIHAKLGVITHQWLGHILRLAFPRANLHGIVPLDSVTRLIPNDHIAIKVKNSAGMTLPPTIPNGHHTHFNTQRTTAFVP